MKGVGGCFVSVPSQKGFLELNTFNRKVMGGIVPFLLVEGVAFVLGNNLAGTHVCMTTVVSEKPSVVLETMVSEREHPAVFMVCVATSCQALADEKGHSSEQDDLSVGLADTFFLGLAEVFPCFQFSFKSFVSKHKMILLKDVAEGFFLQYGVLFKKWQPSDHPMDELWTVCCLRVS